MSVAAFAAPAHWRAIDFISDLHLSAAMPRTAAVWREHLLCTSADAVILLGDLFEVWVGDDACTLPFEAACVDVLRRAARRTTLLVMVGNRDFLLGERFAAACSALLLDDPTVIDAFGQRAIVTHGDAWCLDDTEYQQFRQLVRSADWQQQFLARPLAERQRIAAEIRSRSESRKRFDGTSSADVDPAAAAAALQAAGADVLVHGHTHRPASEAFAGGVRHVLSDWDLDHAARAEVLRWSARGWQRIAPERGGTP